MKPALEGTVALVTGASSGIGAATAAALADPRRGGGAGGAAPGQDGGASRRASATRAAPRWCWSATSPTSSRRHGAVQRTVAELG